MLGTFVIDVAVSGEVIAQIVGDLVLVETSSIIVSFASYWNCMLVRAVAVVIRVAKRSEEVGVDNSEVVG